MLTPLILNTLTTNIYIPKVPEGATREGFVLELKHISTTGTTQDAVFDTAHAIAEGKADTSPA